MNFEKEVISIPAAGTIDLIYKYGVHAHPVKDKGYNYKSSKYYTFRKERGVMEKIFSLETTIVLNVKEELLEHYQGMTSNQVERLKSYFNTRKKTFGFNYPEYRFYLLKEEFELENRPALPKRNNHSYFTIEELKNGTINRASNNIYDLSNQSLEDVINYLKDYQGRPYIKVEKLPVGDLKNEMIQFRESGQNAQQQLLDIANKVIDHPEFSDYEFSKRLGWINLARKGRDYFWIEFKKNEFKESPSSISFVVSVEEYYPTFVALSVEAKDEACTEDDYQKHNRLISRDLPNNDAYYVTTTFKDTKPSIPNLSREEIMRNYHKGEIKKIKLQLDIHEPYTDLISRLRAGIKVLEPYYLLAVSDELSDGYEVIEDADVYYEGNIITVKVNKYERNQEARQKCIDMHGCQCKICGFDFEKVYGVFGKGKIHVHHIKPLNEISKEYIVDPINDLIPVCPNCHLMLHSRKPAFKPNEVKSFIHSNK